MVCVFGFFFFFHRKVGYYIFVSVEINNNFTRCFFFVPPPAMEGRSTILRIKREGGTEVEVI